MMKLEKNNSSIKKILVISPTPSHPTSAGNRARIFNLLSNLKQLGHDVYFAYIEQENADLDSMHQTWGENFCFIPYEKPVPKGLQGFIRRVRSYIGNFPSYPYAIDDWYDNAIDKHLMKLKRKTKFDAVIVEYIFFSKALNLFDESTLKVIDTHDIFADRLALYQGGTQNYQWYSTTIQEEARGLQRANLIIAIQDKEKEYFRRLVGVNVITVGHTVSLRKTLKLDLENKNKVLFVASNNEINVNGINYFINQVFPKIQKVIPDIQLLIAGKICDALNDLKGLCKLGYVDDISRIYDNANIVINPVLFGTGLKIKSIESLGQGKVLITTPEGAKGIESGIDDAFLVARDADEFASLIIRVLSDFQLLSEISQKALNFAKRYNANTIQQLTEILSEC